MVIRAFLGQRIGEALGLARVNIDTIEKGRAIMNEMFGQARVSEMMLAHKGQAEKLDAIILGITMGETAVPQSEGYSHKLFSMRKHFVGEKWDDKLALAKWISFIEGAAITHWKVLHSVAQQANNAELQTLAERYIGFHQTVFDQNTAFLQRYASEL